MAEISFQIGLRRPILQTCPGSSFGMRTSVLDLAQVGTTPVLNACCTIWITSSHSASVVSCLVNQRLRSLTFIPLVPGARPFWSVLRAFSILVLSGILLGMSKETIPCKGLPSGSCLKYS